MFNAKDAKVQAEAQIKMRGEREHLAKHFESLITQSIGRGELTTGKVVFPRDRFKPTLVQEVLKDLKDNGYKVLEGTNNAEQKIIIEVSWS